MVFNNIAALRPIERTQYITSLNKNQLQQLVWFIESELQRGRENSERRLYALKSFLLRKCKKALKHAPPELSKFGGEIERFPYPFGFWKFQRAYLSNAWKVRYLDGDYKVIAWDYASREICKYVEGDIIQIKFETLTAMDSELSYQLSDD